MSGTAKGCEGQSREASFFVASSYREAKAPRRCSSRNLCDDVGQEGIADGNINPTASTSYLSFHSS